MSQKHAAPDRPLLFAVTPTHSKDLTDGKLMLNEANIYFKILSSLLIVIDSVRASCTFPLQ